MIQFLIIFLKVAVIFVVIFPTRSRGLSLPKVWRALLVCLVRLCLHPHTVTTFIQQKGTNVLLTYYVRCGS